MTRDRTEPRSGAPPDPSLYAPHHAPAPRLLTSAEYQTKTDARALPTPTYWISAPPKKTKTQGLVPAGAVGGVEKRETQEGMPSPTVPYAILQGAVECSA